MSPTTTTLLAHRADRSRRDASAAVEPLDACRWRRRSTAPRKARSRNPGGPDVQARARREKRRRRNAAKRQTALAQGPHRTAWDWPNSRPTWSDLRLIARAAREEWDVAPTIARAILRKLVETGGDAAASVPLRIACLALPVRICATTQRRIERLVAAMKLRPPPSAPLAIAPVVDQEFEAWRKARAATPGAEVTYPAGDGWLGIRSDAPADPECSANAAPLPKPAFSAAADRRCEST